MDPTSYTKEGVGENPMRRTILKLCAALVASSVWSAGSRASKVSPERSLKWIAFYGQTSDEQVLSSYDIVILDSMFKGSVAIVAEAGARVCAYLSLGEIRKSDTFY